MSEERSSLSWIALAAAALVVLIGALALFRHLRRPVATTAAPPSAEEQGYLSQIAFTEPHMSAAQNMLGDTITYLDAKVTNKGAKSVRVLTVQLEFVDPFGQVVLRETATPIQARTLPLGPGQTHAFQISFDHMPAEWNQGPPRITPVSVRLQ